MRIRGWIVSVVLVLVAVAVVVIVVLPWDPALPGNPSPTPSQRP
jgi:ABC-type transporter Mla subunit MlaD